MALSKSQRGSIASDLSALLKSGEGADLTFVVVHSQLRAHSIILAARSPVFAAMFRNNMQEARSRCIQITDMQEAALRELLSFLYTDTVPKLKSVAAELLAAADKYDLPVLKMRCEQQMERDLSVDNAAATAALAVLHRCPGLQAAAVTFIAGHPEVLATEGWERVVSDRPATAVQISKLVAAVPRPSLEIEELILPSPTLFNRTSENRIVPWELSQKMATKLLEAARDGAAREAWALLTAGAPKDARDNGGNTALHLAAAGEKATTVKCLLDFGLDVNAASYINETPLHLAAQNYDTDVIWMLVAASARINAQNNHGQTPLHVAAENKREVVDKVQYFVSGRSFDYRRLRYNVVITLLLAGARIDIKDVYGRTPQEVATEETKSAFGMFQSL